MSKPLSQIGPFQLRSDVINETFGPQIDGGTFAVEYSHSVVGAAKIRVDLPRSEREDGQRGCTMSLSRPRSMQIYLHYSLVIWKRVPAHTTLKYR